MVLGSIVSWYQDKCGWLELDRFVQISQARPDQCFDRVSCIRSGLKWSCSIRSALSELRSPLLSWPWNTPQAFPVSCSNFARPLRSDQSPAFLVTCETFSFTRCQGWLYGDFISQFERDALFNALQQSIKFLRENRPGVPPPIKDSLKWVIWYHLLIFSLYQHQDPLAHRCTFFANLAFRAWELKSLIRTLCTHHVDVDIKG